MFPLFKSGEGARKILPCLEVARGRKKSGIRDFPIL